jgi:hypothetical protein
MHYYNFNNKKFKFLAFITKIMSDFRNTNTNSTNLAAAAASTSSSTSTRARSRSNSNQNRSSLSGFYPPSSFEYYYGDLFFLLFEIYSTKLLKISLFETLLLKLDRIPIRIVAAILGVSSRIEPTLASLTLARDTGLVYRKNATGNTLRTVNI